MYLSMVPAVIEDDRAEFAEGRVHHAGHDLGIGAFGQGGEADDVGEQHRGQLALLDREACTRMVDDLRQRRAALSAEALTVCVWRPTAGAALRRPGGSRSRHRIGTPRDCWRHIRDTPARPSRYRSRRAGLVGLRMSPRPRSRRTPPPRRRRPT